MITYRLFRSDASDGLVAVVLYLYRDMAVASVTTIATASPPVAIRLFVESRIHLRRLGVPEADKAALRAAA